MGIVSSARYLRLLTTNAGRNDEEEEEASVSRGGELVILARPRCVTGVEAVTTGENDKENLPAKQRKP